MQMFNPQAPAQTPIGQLGSRQIAALWLAMRLMVQRCAYAIKGFHEFRNRIQISSAW